MQVVTTEVLTMKWEDLLSNKRHGDSPDTKRLIDPARSPFDADYDRVVFSTPFRRLQDKTQVIPMPKSDFVHSRLTHSLEVSCVGRSLGRMVGSSILQKYPTLKDQFSASDFGAIVATAALAHDIGNPPFGHSGEKAIGEYFLNGPGKKFEEEIGDEKKWNDFVKFEGNANGFRTVVNTNTGDEGGLRLTYAVLAAFTKYPKESAPKYREPKRASEKKFGFFQCEREHFKDIANSVNLRKFREDEHYSWARHPLAFIVEAADDICYSIIDFEDGLRLGLIPENKAKELLVPIIGDKFNEVKYGGLASFNEKISYLRSVAIGALINDLAAIFLKNEEAILSGDYDTSLIDDSSLGEFVENIKKITLQKVYRSRNVLEIEAAGFDVLGGLLHDFITAQNDEHAGVKSHRSAKNLDLFPKEYFRNGKSPSADLYERIMSVCEFVAGMTDSAAISLYRKMKGIELPNE
jgi:dGTPase